MWRPTIELINSPEPLVRLCVRKIVRESIDFSTVPLPQEICNLLLEVFREEFPRADFKKSLYFLVQFEGKDKRLSRCNFSGFTINDQLLARILSHHQSSITHLDISNCPNLTEIAVRHLNRIFTLATRQDDSSLCKTISIQEINKKSGYERLLCTRTFLPGQLTWKPPSTTVICEEQEKSIYVCDQDDDDCVVNPVFDHDIAVDPPCKPLDLSFSSSRHRSKIASSSSLMDTTYPCDDYKLEELLWQAKLQSHRALSSFLDEWNDVVNSLRNRNQSGSTSSEPPKMCQFISRRKSQKWLIEDRDITRVLHVKSWKNPSLVSLVIGPGDNLPDVDKEFSSSDDEEEDWVDDDEPEEQPAQQENMLVEESNEDMEAIATSVSTGANVDANPKRKGSHPPSTFLSPFFSLRKLVIHDWNGGGAGHSSFLDYILTDRLKNSLEYLDLSGCSSIGDGSTLTEMKHLKILILYNIPKLSSAIINISKIKTLQALDVSTSHDRFGHSYKNPETTLKLLAESLPNLTHLDISGTNLAGSRHDNIRALSCRYDRPFEFLGLYNTATEAAYRTHLPAARIAGDANEEQILTACEAYIDRVDLLKRTLNDLFHCFRFETDFHDINRALDVVLVAMTRHVREKQIQVAASASLFYIVKSEDALLHHNPKVKRLTIKALLDAMHAHRHDMTMLRNGSLTLIHFRIPQDVLFEYSRVVDILLHIVTNEEDEFVQRLGIYLLNSLACQVDGEQKVLVGDLGAIRKMLDLIDSRIQRRLCDEVMETAWSTMWNVTDETPSNCEKFLDNGGMDYFMKCINDFPTHAELLRNMMGLLGNVAECHHLRHRLMKLEYIEKFTQMLSSTSDGIEVSYNAAGILSHIMSDGESFWNDHLTEIDRTIVLLKMKEAIARWKINSKRNINYRSFEPILRLLHPNIPMSEAQFWACFALANLTRVYSSKYCPLLVADNGIEILQNLLSRPSLPLHVAQYARVTLYQVEKFQRDGDLSSLEDSEEIVGDS